MKRLLLNTGLPIVALLVVAASYVAGRSSGHKTVVSSVVSSERNSQHILYYVDPMHPSYKSNSPGIAPDCGMALVPVYDEAYSHKPTALPGTVSIDGAQQRLIGMKLVEATKAICRPTLGVVGKVQVDETRIYRINSGVDGWLQQTINGTVGSRVHKDDKLATFYSAEFTALEQGYLVATERMAGASKQQAAPGTQSTAARLRNMGMSDKQMAELARTRLMPEFIDILSPGDGFIIARNASSGQRFERNTELYRIADLSHVWITAEVVEDEAKYFRPGMSAIISLPNQSSTLRAVISDSLPQFDPVTRTMMIRMEAANPGYRLRPEMFVDVQLRMQTPACVSVPQDALVDSGNEQRVFVAMHDDHFEPRIVRTGLRFGDRVQIVSGLHEGEQVVASGTFLVDSESRMSDGAGDTIPVMQAKTTPVHQ